MQKKAFAEHKTFVFCDEVGIQLTPNVCRTWAPKGCTPVLVHENRRDKASMIGGLSWNAETDQCDLLLQAYAYENINSERVIYFLKGLKEKFDGPVVLLWDNIGIHRSDIVRQYIDENTSWLDVVRLPAYAPDLNPIEYLWSAWKRTHLANLCPKKLSQIRDLIDKNLAAMEDQKLLKGCLRGPKLFEQAEFSRDSL